MKFIHKIEKRIQAVLEDKFSNLLGQFLTHGRGINMTKLIAILILTCTTAFSQSVIVRYLK